MTIGDQALEEVRRRLYSPEATEEDRDEYRRLVADAVPEPMAAPMPAATRAEAIPAEPSVTAPMVRTPARRPLLLAAALIVVAIAGIAVLAPRPVQHAAAGVPVPLPTALPVDTASRAEFVRTLRHGDGGGIAVYLRTHGMPAEVHATTRTRTIERAGTGPRTVDIRPPGMTTETRRATVLLVVQASGRAGWTVTTLRPYLRGNDPLNLLDQRAVDLAAGAPAYATFTFGPMTQPMSLHVDVQKGVRWGAAVVYGG